MAATKPSGTPRPSGTGVLARLRRVPLTVWLATATFGALLGFWAFVNPAFSPPDEISHADLVFHLATGAGYPEYDERYVSQGVAGYGVMNSLVGADDSPESIAVREWTADSADEVDFGATFDELGGDEAVEGWINQIPQHPPLYYWSSATVLRAARQVNGGQLSMHHELQLLRFTNVVLLTPLPLLAWAAARQLGASDRIGIVASLVPLAIPQLAHVGASVNNDNLFLALCAFLAVPLARATRGDQRLTTALIAGVLAGLALLSKGFGVLLPIWIICCYAAPIVRDRRLLRSALRPVGVALGSFALVGAWFSVRNLVVHGTPSPSLHTATTARESFTPDPGAWLGHFPGFLTQGFWGYFGYFENQIGDAATILGTGLVLVTLASALIGRPRRADSPVGTSRVRLAALVSIFPLLVAFVAVVAWDLYTKTDYLRNFVQGRYLFGAVVPLAVATGVGSVRLVGRWAAVLVLGVASIMQIQGLRLMLDVRWGGAGEPLTSSYRAVVAWNPWPLPLVHLTTAALLMLVAALVVDVVLSTVRPPAADRRGATP